MLKHRDTRYQAVTAGPHRYLVPFMVALALFMETMDSTILSTAVPAIARDIHAPVLSLRLALATYLISLAALVPASGWVADRFGTKRVFVAAMALFLFGSVMCAIQTGLVGFVLARALQGVGGAMMVPVGRLIVVRSVAKKDLIKALTYVVMPALIGPAVGPVVGAAVTTTLGWPWIFFINVPIGVTAILLSLRYLPNVSEPPTAPFDMAGFLLSALGLGSLMLGLSAMGGHVLAMPTSIALIVAGLGLIRIYLLRAGHRTDALLDPGLLQLRTFKVGIFGGTLFRQSAGAAAFLLPLLFQIGFGLSVLRSGVLSAVYALGALMMRTLAPRLIDRFGFRLVLVLGSIACSANTAAFGFIRTPSYAVLLPLLLAGGMLQALVFTAVNSLIFADVVEARMSRATSFSAVIQQFSLTVGIAIPAFVLQLEMGQSRVAPTLAEFGPAFWTASALTLASVGYFLQLRPGDGASLRHKASGLHHYWQ